MFRREFIELLTVLPLIKLINTTFNLMPSNTNIIDKTIFSVAKTKQIFPITNKNDDIVSVKFSAKYLLDNRWGVINRAIEILELNCKKQFDDISCAPVSRDLNPK